MNTWKVVNLMCFNLMILADYEAVYQNYRIFSVHFPNDVFVQKDL